MRNILGYLMSGLIVAGLQVGATEPGPEIAPPKPGCPGCNVVLISIDTLRADHLGSYGYERDTSPTIDRLASQSWVFDDAIAQAPMTLPSHMSVFTGLYPSNHGVWSDGFRLPDETATLASLLGDWGYATAAFTGGGYVSEGFNYHGFDTFESAGSYWKETAASESAQLDRVESWLGDRRRERDRPFFLFWHTYKVHAPYAPHDPGRFIRPGYTGPVDPYPGSKVEACGGAQNSGCQWKGPEYYDLVLPKMGPADVQHVIDHYDAEIAEVDRDVNRLLAMLRRLGMWDRTVVVLLSDHGESFADREHRRRIGHGTMYHEVLRVPFMMRVPGSAARREAGRVELIDVMPTVLDLVGARVPKGIDGRSLTSGGLPAGAEARAEMVLEDIGAAYAERHKVIRRGDELEVYDVEADPAELTPLAASEAVELKDLTELSRFPTGGGHRSGDPVVDETTREQLRALGYY